VSKAPLKPQQRLIILRQYLIPRLLHRLVLGRTPTAVLLDDFDHTIRSSVRRWICLPPSSPVAFLYATQGKGGLGIPCLRTAIPRMRHRRIERMRDSPNGDVAAMCTHPAIRRDLERTRRLLKVGVVTVDTKASEESHWSKTLYETYDGRSLSRAGEAPYTHRWVGGDLAYLSGKEYIHMLRLRINALPLRARLARGRPSFPKTCRAGCPLPETVGHLGICPSVHDNVSKRHNDIVAQLARYLRERGRDVATEVSFRMTPGSTTGSLRPDLVVRCVEKNYVLDVQVVGPNRDLRMAAADKVLKYDIPLIREQLTVGGVPPRVRGIIVSTSGIWDATSVGVLEELGLPKSKILNLTCLAMQGTLRVWRAHNAVKRVTTRGYRAPAAT